MGKLATAITNFLEGFGFGRRIKEWFIDLIEGIEKETALEFQPLAKLVTTDLGELPEIQKMFNKILSGKGQSGIIASGGFAAQMGMGAASGLLAPISRQLNYGVDFWLKTGRVDPAVAFAMMWRLPEAKSDLELGLKHLGWGNEMQGRWEKVLRPRLGVADLIRLERRGLMTLEEIFTEITAKGWETLDVQRLRLATEVQPTVQDLVNMAVREAFDPGQITALGLDQEIPGVFLAEAKKIGLSDAWAKKYWYAHWRLPSVGQAFQMLHRLRSGTTNTPFTETDLKGVLKALDISPAWRDRLQAISYLPMTRVDTRRLYDTGVIDEETVMSNYLDVGYNPDTADKLTEWTVRDKQSAKKSITQAAIIKAFKQGTYTLAQAEAALVTIGFDDIEAGFYVSLAAFEIEQAKVKDALSGIEFLYVEGEINSTDVYGRLGTLNIASERIASFIEIWDIKREKKIRLASRAELDDFYLNEIIDDNTYRAELVKKRYPVNLIDWFVAKLDIKNVALAQAEADRARLEQERLQDRTTVSVYSIAKASLDVNIAELKVVLAEIKVSVLEATTPEQKSELEERTVDTKKLIAELNLEKANLRHDLEQALGD